MRPSAFGTSLDNASAIGQPLMESIQGIIIGAEVLGHLELPSDGAVKHAAECDTIDRAGMDSKPYDRA
jgi:hypothetical protein